MLTSALSMMIWTLAIDRMIRFRFRIERTTLLSALPWALAAAILWWLVAACGLFPGLAGRHGRSYLGYVAAVVSLTPVMAVLGARRPTVRVWPMFVLLPMLVVLLWSPASILAAHGGRRMLQLESPQIIIYGFVTLMGFGNYFGTPLTLPAIWVACNLILSVTTLSTGPHWDADRQDEFLTVASIGTGLGCLWALRIAKRPVVGEHRFDRVWREFMKLYGLVWSRRLYDRLVILAERQHWSCRVLSDGFALPNQPDLETEARVEHALRWLLRRFVDSSWLDERLGTTAENSTSVAIDL